MLYQRTIAKKVVVTGLGLHSGKKVTLTLNPAEANTGIRFKRTDIENSPIIEATATNVCSTENNTTIGSGNNVIYTVEHLLSVLYGLGINNVLCEINGPEIPIMDGSGASFVFIIKETGIRHLNQSKKFLVILEPIRVEHGDAWAMISPHYKLMVDTTIIFPHPQIKMQKKVFDFTCENFIKEVSRARTFGLLKDVDALKRKGLIRGGSLDNAVVLDDFNVINKEGLRFQDEPVRHKILDILGDLSLLGHEIAGKVTTYKSGHSIHNMLCRKILESPHAYETVSASSLEKKTVDSYQLPMAISVAP